MKRILMVSDPTKPTPIPVKNWESILKACCNAEAEVEHLQDTIETLNLRIEDYKTTIAALEADCLAEAQRHCNVKAQLNSIKNEHTRELAYRETRFSKVLRELETTESNRKYAYDHIHKLNQFIQDAKATIEKLRAEIQTLTDSKVNSEHLAKKLVELQTDKARLIDENGSMACPYQRTKNIIHLRCGKCTACKLEAAEGIIHRTSENVESVQREVSELEAQVKFKSNILQQTTTNLEAANKERDAANKVAKTITVENEKLNYELGILRDMLGIQEIALKMISKGSFFGHARMAHNALESVKSIQASLTNVQNIQSGERDRNGI